MLDLGAYLESLSEGAESRGEITVDPVRAAAVMARWQLPGPDHYLLKLVQAGVAANAACVRCRVGWWSVDIELELPQGQALEPLAAGYLAVGVQAALAGARAVTMEHQQRRRVYSREGTWEEKAPAGRAGLRLRVARTRWDTGPEIRLLEERCGWSPIPIWINGRPRPIESWGSSLTLVQSYPEGHALSAPGTSRARLPPRVTPARMGRRILCGMALALEPAEDEQLHFVQHGVMLWQLTTELGVPGLRGVVGGDDLPTDLGGFQLREGKALRERIARVRDETLAMVERTKETS